MIFIYRILNNYLIDNDIFKSQRILEQFCSTRKVIHFLKSNFTKNLIQIF